MFCHSFLANGGEFTGQCVGLYFLCFSCSGDGRIFGFTAGGVFVLVLCPVGEGGLDWGLSSAGFMI